MSLDDDWPAAWSSTGEVSNCGDLAGSLMDIVDTCVASGVDDPVTPVQMSCAIRDFATDAAATTFGATISETPCCSGNLDGNPDV